MKIKFVSLQYIFMQFCGDKNCSGAQRHVLFAIRKLKTVFWSEASGSLYRAEVTSSTELVGSRISLRILICLFHVVFHVDFVPAEWFGTYFAPPSCSGKSALNTQHLALLCCWALEQRDFGLGTYVLVCWRKSITQSIGSGIHNWVHSYNLCFLINLGGRCRLWPFILAPYASHWEARASATPIWKEKWVSSSRKLAASLVALNSTQELTREDSTTNQNIQC